MVFFRQSQSSCRH